MDSPYIFRATGIMVYNEPSNPYETVEIYMGYEPGNLVVKSYISEHGPDGGSSWRGVFIQDAEVDKLKLVVGGNMKAFLRKYFLKNANRGLDCLAEFLKEHGIAYEEKYAF